MRDLCNGIIDELLDLGILDPAILTRGKHRTLHADRRQNGLNEAEIVMAVYAVYMPYMARPWIIIHLFAEWTIVDETVVHDREPVEPARFDVVSASHHLVHDSNAIVFFWIAANRI